MPQTGSTAGYFDNHILQPYKLHRFMRSGPRMPSRHQAIIEFEDVLELAELVSCFCQLGVVWAVRGFQKITCRHEGAGEDGDLLSEGVVVPGELNKLSNSSVTNLYQ